jgi:hypothetical protein
MGTSTGTNTPAVGDKAILAGEPVRIVRLEFMVHKGAYVLFAGVNHIKGNPRARWVRVSTLTF